MNQIEGLDDLRKVYMGQQLNQRLQMKHPWPARFIEPQEFNHMSEEIRSNIGDDSWSVQAIDGSENSDYSLCTEESECVDCLIIWVRHLLSLGLDYQQSDNNRLFDLAFHNFGWNREDDFRVRRKVVKELEEAGGYHSHGNIAQKLFIQTIHSTLVQDSVFANKDFALVDKQTWRVGENGEMIRYDLSSREIAFIQAIRYRGTESLSNAVSQKLGERIIGIHRVIYTCMFPRFICVRYSTHTVAEVGVQMPGFTNLRSFELLAESRKVVGLNRVEFKPCSRHYHLCFAICSEKEYDCRAYNLKVEPVVRILSKDEARDYKSINGRRWLLGDPGNHFILFYRRVDIPEEEYVPPSSTTEYGDPLTRFHELVDISEMVQPQRNTTSDNQQIPFRTRFPAPNPTNDSSSQQQSSTRSKHLECVTTT